jgi:hypothetical protein
VRGWTGGKTAGATVYRRGGGVSGEKKRKNEFTGEALVTSSKRMRSPTPWE